MMSSATIISPESCRDMAEIRHEIDRIDQQVISLIGERYQFVKAAAKFKKRRIRCRQTPGLSPCSGSVGNGRWSAVWNRM